MTTYESDDGKQQEDKYSAGDVEQNPDTFCRLVKGCSARLKLAVLTGAVLKVEVDVTIVVAMEFVVHSRVGERHLFGYRCLQFWHIVNAWSGGSHIEALNSLAGLSYAEIAVAEIAPRISYHIVVVSL